MSKRITLIILLTFFGFSILFFIDKQQIKNRHSKNTNIVAFGDSLTYGVGSTTGNDFISILSKRINQPIINLGVSGDTTSKALERIDKVTSLNPKLVIVLLGGNDYLQKVSPEKTFNNLSKIIDQIHATGSAVLLLGIRGGLLRDIYASNFKELAKEKKVGFVPNVLDGLIGNSTLMSDAVHPNDQGYLLIAQKVEPQIKRILE